MSTPGTDFAQVMAEYLAAVDAGTPVDRAAWIARYPAHADALRRFFDDDDLLGQKLNVPPDETKAIPPQRISPQQVAVATSMCGTPEGDAGPPATAKVRLGGPELRLRTPQSIAGYQILRELHRGGQGIVYQAVQQSTKRKVAVKVLLEGPFASEGAKRRFEREIDLIAQLKHASIITIFDSGVTPSPLQGEGRGEGLSWFAMDYVRGLPLRDYVRENKLTLEQTLKLFAQVCEAVQYAHQKGVIHRDLKPGNILVDSDGVPKVLDFGLAKQMLAPVETVISLTGNVVGTLPYMSPEQARGNPDHIDTRTDVYALGVILYELLTGHYPYPVVGLMDEVLRHIRDTPPTPPSRAWRADSGVGLHGQRKLRPGQCPIDDEVQTIVLKALTKERERRYQSAGDLAKDVAHYLADEPIEARRDSGWYVLKKTLRHYRLQAAVAALFVVVVTTGFLTSLRFWRHAAVDRDRAVAAKQAEGRERARAEQALDTANVARTAAEGARDEAEYQAYTAALSAALADLARGDGPAVRRRLDATAERLRGWEWEYLWNNADRSLATLLTLPASPDAYFFGISPDASLAAIRQGATSATATRVVDIRSGRVVTETPALWHMTKSLTFSPDNRYLAWSYLGHDHVQVFDIHAKHWVLPDDLEEWSDRFCGFDPTSKYAAIFSLGSDKLPLGAHLFEVEGWRHIRHLPGPWKDPPGGWHSEDFPEGGAFSPDGSLLAIAPGRGDPLRVHRLPQGELAFERDLGIAVSSVAFSPDSTMLAALGRDWRIRVFNTDSWTLAAEITLPGPVASHIAFGHDERGQMIIVGGTDGVVRCYSAGGKLRFESRGCATGISAVHLDAKTNEIISAHADGSMRSWDAHRTERGVGLGRVAFGTTPSILIGHRSAFAADPTCVSFADLESGRETGRLHVFPVSIGHGFSATEVAPNPDGKRCLVTGGTSWNTGRFKIFDARTAQGLFISQEYWNDDLYSAAWSRDGKLFVVGGEAGTLYAFDGDSYAARRARKIHGKRITALAFTPDDKYLLSASNDGTVRMLEVAGGGEVHCLGTVGDPGIKRLVISPEGSTFATGAEDGTIAVRRASDGELITQLRGHGRPIRGLSFLPDGSRLASGSLDRSIRIWDCRTWRELMTIWTDTAIQSLAFSPDGCRLVYNLADSAFVQLDMMPELERSARRRAEREARQRIRPMVRERLARQPNAALVAEGIQRDASLNDLEQRLAQQELLAMRTEERARVFDSTRLESFIQRPLWRYVFGAQLVSSHGDDWEDFGAVAIRMLRDESLPTDDREALAEYVVAMRYFPKMLDDQNKNPGAWTNELAARICVDPQAEPLDYALGLFGMEAVVSQATDDAHKLNYLNTLATLWYRNGLDREAVKAAQESEQINASDPAIASANYAVLAMAHQRLGEMQAARDDLQVAEEQAKKSPQPLADDIKSLLDEARRLLSGPQTTQAVTPLTRAELDTMREQILLQYPNDCQAIQALVRLYRKQGRHEDADRLLEQAVDRIADPQWQWGDPSDRLLQLAGFLRDEGKLEQAERAFRKTVELRRRAYGDAHEMTLRALIECGGFLLVSRHDFEQAGRLAEEALQLQKEVYGDTHQSVGRRLADLAKVRFEQGRYEEAERLVVQALDITRSAGDADWIKWAETGLAESRKRRAELESGKPAFAPAQPE